MSAYFTLEIPVACDRSIETFNTSVGWRLSGYQLFWACWKRDVPQHYIMVKDLVMDILVNHVCKSWPSLNINLWLLKH